MPRDRIAALRQVIYTPLEYKRYNLLVIFQIQGQAFVNDNGGGEERPNGFSGYGGDTMVVEMESRDDGLSGFLMQVWDLYPVYVSEFG